MQVFLSLATIFPLNTVKDTKVLLPDETRSPATLSVVLHFQLVANKSLATELPLYSNY